MKIRARLGTTTKVVVIEDNVASYVQISEMRLLIQKAFGCLLNQPFKMGLNKTEPFSNEDVTIKECGIVDCDLIYVLPENPIPVFDAKKIKIKEKMESKLKEKHMSECPKEASKPQPQGPVDLSSISPYMTKMLFCYESTSNQVPEQLQMLLSSSAAAMSHEIVIVALHQLLLESGFQFATNVIVAESSSPENVPANLSEIFTIQRSHSFYRLFYIHPDAEGVTAMLICIPMLKMLVIQGKLLNFPLPKENPPEIIVNSENFVTQLRTDSAALVYKNLRTLSADFKDSVALRLLIEMKIALGIEDNSGFLGLFSEIKLKILKYLDFRSLLAMSLVCKDLYDKSRDASLWRRLFMIHKTVHFPYTISEDWFDNFKILYEHLERQSSCRKFSAYVFTRS